MTSSPFAGFGAPVAVPGLADFLTSDGISPSDFLPWAGVPSVQQTETLATQLAEHPEAFVVFCRLHYRDLPSGVDPAAPSFKNIDDICRASECTHTPFSTRDQLPCFIGSTLRAIEEGFLNEDNAEAVQKLATTLLDTAELLVPGRGANYCARRARMTSWTVLQALKMLAAIVLVQDLGVRRGQHWTNAARESQRAVKLLLDVAVASTEWLLARQRLILTTQDEAWLPEFQADDAHLRSQEDLETAYMLRTILVVGFGPGPKTDHWRESQDVSMLRSIWHRLARAQGPNMPPPECSEATEAAEQMYQSLAARLQELQHINISGMDSISRSLGYGDARRLLIPADGGFDIDISLWLLAAETSHQAAGAVMDFLKAYSSEAAARGLPAPDWTHLCLPAAEFSDRMIKVVHAYLMGPAASSTAARHAHRRVHWEAAFQRDSLWWFKPTFSPPEPGMRALKRMSTRSYEHVRWVVQRLVVLCWKLVLALPSVDNMAHALHATINANNRRIQIDAACFSLHQALRRRTTTQQQQSVPLQVLPEDPGDPSAMPEVLREYWQSHRADLPVEAMVLTPLNRSHLTCDDFREGTLCVQRMQMIVDLPVPQPQPLVVAVKFCLPPSHSDHRARGRSWVRKARSEVLALADVKRARQNADGVVPLEALADSRIMHMLGAVVDPADCQRDFFSSDINTDTEHVYQKVAVVMPWLELENLEKVLLGLAAPQAAGVDPPGGLLHALHMLPASVDEVGWSQLWDASRSFCTMITAGDGAAGVARLHTASWREMVRGIALEAVKLLPAQEPWARAWPSLAGEKYSPPLLRAVPTILGALIATSWRAVVLVVLEVVQAATEVHRLGIAHNDIAARNVMLAAHGRPALSDFDNCVLQSAYFGHEVGPWFATALQAPPEVSPRPASPDDHAHPLYALDSQELVDIRRLQEVDVWQLAIMALQLCCLAAPYTDRYSKWLRGGHECTAAEQEAWPRWLRWNASSLLRKRHASSMRPAVYEEEGTEDWWAAAGGGWETLRGILSDMLLPAPATPRGGEAVRITMAEAEDRLQELFTEVVSRGVL